MRWWRKLRGRIFGSHLIVVVTGVACLLLTTEIIISNRTYIFYTITLITCFG